MPQTITARQIANKHFLIRIYYYNEKSHIVRYNGLVKTIGLGHAKRLIYEAQSSKMYKYTYRSRKGFRIDFYAI